MFTFKEYCRVVLEGAEEAVKNKHLEHIEDEIINHGATGVEKALSYFNNLLDTLAGHSDEPINITTKWDGAPAIFCGTDPEDGRFFVGTKGVFAKMPKLNKTVKDIARNHPDDVKNDEVISKKTLRDKLTTALKYLSKLGIRDFVVQGDMLYTKDMIRKVNIDGESYLSFKPNTITYAVPVNSQLAAKILQTKIGIIFHTMYTGPTVGEMGASFGFDASNLTQTKDVWFDDANFKDVSGQVNLTEGETQHIRQAIETARNLHGQIGDVYGFMNSEQCKDLTVDLKAHVNAIIRERGVFEQDPSAWANQFIERYVDKTNKAIAKLKTEAGQAKKRNAMQACINYLRENWEDVQNLYRVYLSLIEVKMTFMEKLSNLKMMTDTFIEEPDGSFRVTDPEGFVAVDHLGSAVKLVDRLEFSRQNFMPGKKFG